MRKLRPRRFCIRFGCSGGIIESGNSKKQEGQRRVSSSSSASASSSSSSSSSSSGGGMAIKWEVRPGGMLVQKREEQTGGEELITVRVSTVSQFWDDISIEPTSTFGELKMLTSLVTGLEPREQRILFKGKEREDNEFLHMVGVKDKDKVFLLEDPAVKEMKLLGLSRSGTTLNPITV